MKLSVCVCVWCMAKSDAQCTLCWWNIKSVCKFVQQRIYAACVDVLKSAYATVNVCDCEQRFSNIFFLFFFQQFNTRQRCVCALFIANKRNARLIKDLLWIVYVLAISTKICEQIHGSHTSSPVPLARSSISNVIRCTCVWKTDFVFILNSWDLGLFRYGLMDTDQTC